MVDPFHCPQKESDLAPLLFPEKGICLVNLVFPLAEDSENGFLLLLFLALRRYFIVRCESIWLYLWDGFLSYSLLFMQVFCFILM